MSYQTKSSPWYVRFACWLLRVHVRRVANKNRHWLNDDPFVIGHILLFDFARSQGGKLAMLENGNIHLWTRVREGADGNEFFLAQKETLPDALGTFPISGLPRSRGWEQLSR